MAEISMDPVGVSSAGEIARVHTASRAAYYLAASPGCAVPGGELDYEPMWRRRLGATEYAVLGATLRDRIVGFLAMRKADPVELVALYVEPGHWGEGIASLLHADFSERLGGSRATLEVWSRNDRAIRFYLDRGWQVSGGSRPAHDGTTYVAMEKRA